MMLVVQRREQAMSVGEDVLPADTLLGVGLPSAAEQHLYQAGLAYQHDDIAEQHLRDAQALAPDHAAVLIGLYRFFFYKGRLGEALEIAQVCLEKAARDNGLAVDWRCVQHGDADFSSFDAMLPRFYLFTLKAYAYLQMRLGNMAEGHAAIQKMLELDPSDKLNAGVLLAVWKRTGQVDDD